MIHVERHQRDEAGRLIEPSQQWFVKAEELTQQAITEGAEHETDNHYRHDEVRKALEKMFHAKCAYCERRLDEPEWDVEHYRPKGRVAECSDHPGYYWLSYGRGSHPEQQT